MEIKDTLLTPKTSFEMKANLPSKEPLIQKRWMEQELYQKVLAKNKDKKPFILHDGPPYANGDIHLGHALNKVLKDFVVRYKSMQGYYTPFIPGWDTHGLPIETALTKKGVNRKEMSTAAFREKCEEYALIQVARQKEQFLRLGPLSDFKQYYVTLDRKFEASQIRVFAKMALDGLIYKGLKPVLWSYSSETALAEAEIEYHDVTSESIYVAFKVKDGKKVLKGDEQFIIWTTTPWTLPANLAISLNPTMDYGVYETNKGVFIFLDSLKDKIASNLDLKILETRNIYKGKELEFITTTHPFYDRESVIIVGDHVMDDSGTGCVHTAPGHGEDDYIVGLKYNLDILCPVDSKGMMMEEAGDELKGLFYEDANVKVLEILKQKGALLKSEKITHSYPHDWRTQKPVIFRATAQWFASIDKIRLNLLKEISRVTWYPKWGEVRLHNMIKDRGDWCISRQRTWGVPLPIIYNEDGSPIIEAEVFENIAKLINEYGSNIWFSSDVKELLPKNYTNAKSPNNGFYKETDIMDVWFDSGSTSNGVVIANDLAFPSDLYLEGSDQYRGWFNSSLIIATAVNGKAPYKNIVSHGFILDGKGNKMSKSLGNVIDPNKIASQYGAEILRLLIANVDYQADVRISDDLIKQISESYRKIRNTFRFILGNLQEGKLKYDPIKDEAKSFSFIDRFILERLNQVINQSINSYDNYDFASATQAVLNFLSIDLSSFYLDITKDILYCESYNSLRRRQVLTVLYRIFDNLIRILTPILPHTCEELYLHFHQDKESVCLLDMPKKHKLDLDLINEYDNLMILRSDVLKALENARASGLIGSAQEASVTLYIKDEKIRDLYNKLDQVEKNRFFIVSEVKDVLSSDGLEIFNVSSVKVEKHPGVRCERCWNRFDEKILSSDKVCPRCAKAMKIYEKDIANHG